MKQLSKNQFEKAQAFVSKNARPLDIAVFEHLFEGKGIETVFGELRKFQNTDKGFGNGLEPDFRTPKSSNMATTFAFQYMDLLEINELHYFILDSLEFLANSYDRNLGLWIPVPKEVNDSPHAFWWEYNADNYRDDSNWGNPTVEILGYLLKYPNSFDRGVLKQIQKKAIDRLLSSKSIEVHELQCYVRLLKNNPDLESVIGGKVDDLVVNSVEKDPSKWVGYVTRPSTFISAPDSRFYGLMKDAFDYEVNTLFDSQADDGGWYPSWSWSSYLSDWQKVKIEIAGMITVRNLVLLKRFGKV